MDERGTGTDFFYMAEERGEFVHLRFENEKIIEGRDLFERVCLLCTVNDEDIRVEVPIVK